MIHNIDPKVFDNSYRQEVPNQNSYMIFIRDNEILSKEIEGEIVFPRLNELDFTPTDFIYLFAIDDQTFFLSPAAKSWGEYNYTNIIEFRKKKPKYLAFAASVAVQLSGWYDGNRYCGKCGRETVRDGKERMLKCEHCHSMVYPKISPAVIVGVIDGDRLLMTKYAGRVYKNYALIAGFSEIGEPIEDTVRREVLEEAGVRVKNIRFYKSQPWPFSASLLMGFYCDLDGPDDIVIDEDELEVAEWICREDIGVSADDVSLTNEMIVNFKEHRE